MFKEIIIMFCPNCGSNNADGVAFCANCGCQLNQQPQQQAAPQPEYQQPQPEFQQPQPEFQQPQPEFQQPQPEFQQPQQQYQPPYQPPFVPNASAPVPGKGLGITGMVLGIVSLVLLCFLGPFSLILAIVGVILSGIGYSQSKKANAKNGMAVAGIVCSSIAIGIYLICILIVVAFGVSVGGMMY